MAVKKISKEVVFGRAPIAAETFSDDNKKKFDKLAPKYRHFIKQVINLGDVKLAAKQAKIDTSNLPGLAQTNRDPSQVLTEHKMGVEDVMAYLHDCLVSDTIRFDKHGNLHQTTDLKTRLEAIKLIFQVHGVLDKKHSPNKKKQVAAIDMFDNVEDGDI